METKARFVVSGLSESFFQCHSYEISTGDFCHGYHYSVQVLTEHVLNISELINVSASLSRYCGHAGWRNLPGHIIEIRELDGVCHGIGHANRCYSLNVSSPLSLLSKVFHSSVYPETTPADITQYILSKAGWQPKQYVFNLQCRQTTRQHTIQYEESDLALLQRIMTQSGIYFFYDLTGELPCLQFNDTWPPNCHHGISQVVNHTAGLLPPTPHSMWLTNQNQSFIFHYQNINMSQGQVIRFSDVDDRTVPPLCITKLYEVGNPNGCRGVCYGRPLAQPFQVPRIDLRQPVHHVLLAEVKSVKAWNVYHLRFDFEDVASPGSDVGVVALTPNADKGNGWHYLFAVGSQVAVSFVQGDTDYPVVLGGIASQNYPSPVTDVNLCDKQLQTPKGHALLWHQRQGREALVLQTFAGENRLSMVHEDGHWQLDLISSGGGIAMTARKTVWFHSSRKLTWRIAGASHIQAKGNLVYQSRQNNLSFYIGELYQGHYQGDSVWHAQSGDIRLNADTTYSSWSGYDTQLATEGEARFATATGKLSVRATSMTLQAPVMRFATSGGAVTIGRRGMDFQGQKVVLVSANITLSF